MPYDISIIVTSIRSHLLPNLYNSIGTSFSGSWEMIIVSPNEIPKEILEKDNVKYIKDMGSPTRCWQIALLNATGEYIQYTCDDATYFPGSLDATFSLLKGKNYKNIILCKYTEGELKLGSPMLRNEYYHLNKHDLIAGIIYRMGKNYLLLNVCLMTRKLLLELGGFDCEYECCGMTLVDLSIRALNYGAKISIQNDVIFEITFLCGTEGDHAPVHYAHTDHDLPLFLETYLNLDNANRTTIDINNYKNQPDIWERRFK